MKVRMCNCKQLAEQVVKQQGGKVVHIPGPITLRNGEGLKDSTFSFHDVAQLPDGRIVDNTITYANIQEFYSKVVVP